MRLEGRRAHVSLFLMLIAADVATADNTEVLRIGVFQNLPNICTGESGPVADLS